MTAFTLHQKKLDSEINAENDLNEKIKFLKLIE
jgi:hypothetical protein